MTNQEAIEKLKEILFMTGYKEALDLAIKALEERSQGEWKLDSLGAYCSECGTHPDYSSNYCPNCGADMRGM